MDAQPKTEPGKNLSPTRQPTSVGPKSAGQWCHGKECMDVVELHARAKAVVDQLLSK